MFFKLIIPSWALHSERIPILATIRFGELEPLTACHFGHLASESLPNMKLLVFLSLACLFSSALAVNFIDIVMEEWEDWKLSHSKLQFLSLHLPFGHCTFSQYSR